MKFLFASTPDVGSRRKDRGDELCLPDEMGDVILFVRPVVGAIEVAVRHTKALTPGQDCPWDEESSLSLLYRLTLLTRLLTGKPSRSH
jgi:hypothetical protein